MSEKDIKEITRADLQVIEKRALVTAAGAKQEVVKVMCADLAVVARVAFCERAAVRQHDLGEVISSCLRANLSLSTI